MGVRLLRGLLGLGRGISTVVGAAILLAVMVLAATFYITALDKLVTASQQAMKRVSEAASTTATLSSVKALWSFNGSHITIYIENQAPKTLLVVAIAVVYTDGSHSVWDKANSTSIALPLAVAPATSTTIAIDTGGKTPATASLAVEASPVVAVVAAKRQDQAPTTRAITIEPVAPGATTWLGKAAIPTTKNATTTKNYPQQLTSTPLNSTITRISRSTITYTDFEVVPVPGWTNYGGSWSSFKGSALQGTDQNVVETGVDGRIEVYDTRGSLVAMYTASDCILGGDAYTLAAVYYGATFSDVASFSRVVQLFSANVNVSLATNASVTLRVYVNGSQILCKNIAGSDSISASVPSSLLGGARVFNVMLVFNSTQPFSVTINWLGVLGFGYFEDYVTDSLLLGSGTAIRFYNATKLLLSDVTSLTALYSVPAYTQFSGSAAIAYNSSSYVLYMVNGSGVYFWNPLGWSLVVDNCRAVGSGARVEVVGRFVVVLPGEPSGYACVYDVSRGVAYNISLATYRLYRYTASAVNGTAVVFTALDNMGRVALLSLDLSTNSTRRLAVLPMSCATGLAVSSSRAYIVLCGVWRGVIGVEGSGAAVWIYDAKARTSGLVLVTNNSTVQLMGCCDRVEIYKDMLIAVDTQNILTIDRASKLVVEKSATIYGT